MFQPLKVVTLVKSEIVGMVAPFLSTQQYRSPSVRSDYGIVVQVDIRGFSYLADDGLR